MNDHSLLLFLNNIPKKARYHVFTVLAFITVKQKIKIKINKSKKIYRNKMNWNQLGFVLVLRTQDHEIILRNDINIPVRSARRALQGP